MNTARFVDERSIPSAVDVLIVGSGPIGSTYARIIADTVPSASVLMVEAGPRLTATPGVHVRDIVDQEQRDRAVRLSEGSFGELDGPRLTAHFDTTVNVPAPAPGTSFIDGAAFGENRPMAAAARSRNVGGMGIHWATATPTPMKSERAGFIPDDEWDRILRIGRGLMDISSEATTDSPEWKECLDRLGREFDHRRSAEGAVRNMPLARQQRGDGSVYWSGTDVILGHLARRERDTFAIAADTIVQELLISDTRVRGAVLNHRPSGTRVQVDAKVVIVAAGSLHTPQLLWASGVRPGALGRYLNDHTMVGALVSPDYLDAPDDPAQLFAKTRTLNNVTDAPSSGMGWIPNADPAHPIHGQFGQTLVRPEGGGRAVGVVMFGYMLAKEPRYEDRVWFDDSSLDQDGMPRMRFDYGYSEADLELQRFAASELDHIGKALGACDIRVTTQTDGMSLHYLGSVRAGALDDGSSVCDDSLRVWGYENLFVGGNGVIPTQLACNPTLTSVAMAVRSAEKAASLLG